MSSVIPPSLEEIISRGCTSSIMMTSPFLLLRELKMVKEEVCFPQEPGE